MSPDKLNSDKAFVMDEYEIGALSSLEVSYFFQPDQILAYTDAPLTTGIDIALGGGQGAGLIPVRGQGPASFPGLSPNQRLTLYNLDAVARTLLLIAQRGYLPMTVTAPVETISVTTILYSAYVLARDQKVQGISGGTFTSGAWRTRTLTNLVADTGGNASLAANQITLLAGTYRVLASAPAFKVERHQLRLQDITGGTTLVLGQAAFSKSTGDFAATPALLSGHFTLGATTVLELQHRCETTLATNGMGIACNFDTEIYAVIELFKEVA